MARRRTDIIGRAGEHYVAAELNRRGAYASPFSGNVRGFDIVATNADGTSAAFIQVKTKREGGSWQVGVKTGWAKIELNDCPESKPRKCSPPCTPLLEEPIHGKPNHYWVFVTLQRDGGQNYYIVPDDVVRSDLVRDSHKKYLQKHGGERPGPKHDSLHLGLVDKTLKPWEDKWGTLGLGIVD